MSRGRLSRSAALRSVLKAWVAEGRAQPAFERERPEELVVKSFSLEDELLKSLEDATVAWSTGELLVDRSLVVRALIDVASRSHERA